MCICVHVLGDEVGSSTLRELLIESGHILKRRVYLFTSYLVVCTVTENHGPTSVYWTGPLGGFLRSCLAKGKGGAHQGLLDLSHWI